MASKTITTAKVAQIISPGQVAFNVGTNRGVQDGDDIVLNERIVVTDPDTQERLGAVLVPKLNLRVNLVTEKYCVGRVTSTRLGTSKIGTSGASVFSGTKTVTTNEWEADLNTVLITIGEEAQVKRTIDEDEPPF